jgi:hypothetical protein
MHKDNSFTEIELLRARAENSPFLSIKQTSVRYGISVRTLRRLQAAGKMPPRIKQSRKLVYRKADLAALFERSSVSSLKTEFSR